MKKYLKRILAFTMVWTLVISTTVYAADSKEETTPHSVEVSAVEYQDSGCTGVKKMSMEELKALYNGVTECPSDLYEVIPTTGANYKLGKLASQPLQHTEDYINFIRTQAGLPKVQLKAELNESAQYGALTLAMRDKGLSHTPEQPEFMSKEDYDKGYAATSSSNISSSQGYNSTQVLKVAIQGQMDDEDSRNIDKLGHRRWLLKPQTTTFGVGNAKSDTGWFFTCVRVFGDGIQSTAADYDFISWPASGNMLRDVFGANVPWSITVNPSHYQTPDFSKVKVELTRLSDGKQFVFDQNDYTETPDLDKEYFNVEGSYYGINNCIIFRPIVSEIEEYSGEYDVRVTGLCNINGAEKELRYKVNFDAVVPLTSISLDHTTLELDERGWEYLKVIYNPENATDDKKITWTSSNENVATVTWNGLVQAVAPGTAVITAKVGNKTATCTVTVKGQEIPLQSISLNKTILTMEKEGRERLTVSYNPYNTTANRDVTWTSSNQNAAIVDSYGNVTAVNIGTAVITAKVGTKTAQCKVTVTVAEHSWNNGDITKTATCTEAGEKTYTCEDCGETKTEEIKALGHAYAAEWTIDKKATCTETGSKSHHCGRCNAKKDITVIPVVEHSWNSGKITKEATCTGAGEKTYACKVCGETKTEVIKALGHAYAAEWTIDKKATCTETGSKSHHCGRCNERKDITVIPLEAHSSQRVTTPATVRENGKIVDKCSVCGKILSSRTIYYPETISLSYAKYTYNGSVKTPKVTVKDSKGNQLILGTDYTVTYADGRTNPGSYSVTVTFKGHYSGTKEMYFTIVPKAPSSVSAKLYGYDDVQFSWSKSTGASGYAVYYKKSTASGYTYMTRTTGTSIKKSGLTDGAKYYFKVVPYKTIDGNRNYGASKSTYIYTLKKVSTPRVSKSGTKVKVRWTNISGESGYQVSKSTSKTGTNIVSTYKTTSGTYKTVSATKGKTYYYKVRAYREVDGKKIYGPWSYVVRYRR